MPASIVLPKPTSSARIPPKLPDRASHCAVILRASVRNNLPAAPRTVTSGYQANFRAAANKTAGGSRRQKDGPGEHRQGRKGSRRCREQSLAGATRRAPLGRAIRARTSFGETCFANNIPGPERFFDTSSSPAIPRTNRAGGIERVAFRPTRRANCNGPIGPRAAADTKYCTSPENCCPNCAAKRASRGSPGARCGGCRTPVTRATTYPPFATGP